MSQLGTCNINNTPHVLSCGCMNWCPVKQSAPSGEPRAKCPTEPKCPKCGKGNIGVLEQNRQVILVKCPDCQQEWVCSGLYELAAFFPLEHVGEPAPGWISVEERLPEEGKYVLVFEPVGGIFVGFHIRLSWCDSRGITRSLEQVTHWQPLPEPPAGLSSGR